MTLEAISTFRSTSSENVVEVESSGSEGYGTPEENWRAIFRKVDEHLEGAKVPDAASISTQSVHVAEANNSY